MKKFLTDRVVQFLAALSLGKSNVKLNDSNGEILSDIVALVKEAHRFGIKVYFDVVMNHNGNPGKIENGKEIFGLEEVKRIEGVKVYHAGTRWESGRLYTSGGRVLNVTARGATLAEALERAYFVAQMIEFEGKDYRKDIGRKGLAKQP